jgi:hypothetical protein
MRELTPPGAETFIFPSFSRHIENSLICSFQKCYRSQCVVPGSAVSVQIAKSDFLSAAKSDFLYDSKNIERHSCESDFVITGAMNSLAFIEHGNYRVDYGELGMIRFKVNDRKEAQN